MKLSSVFLATILTLMTSVFAFAQDKPLAEASPKTEKMHKHNKGERLAKALDLNENQIAQMEKIRENYKTKRKAIIDANDGDRKAAKTQLKSLREAQKADMRAILTPEQQTQFDELKEKHGKRRGGKGKRDGKRGDRLEKMTETLGLSDTQVTQMKAIHEKYRSQKEALREKNEGNDRSAIKEEMKAIREAQRSEMKAVLTTEQLAKFEEMKAARKEKRGKRGRGGNKTQE